MTEHLIPVPMVGDSYCQYKQAHQPAVLSHGGILACRDTKCCIIKQSFDHKAQWLSSVTTGYEHCRHPWDLIDGYTHAIQPSSFDLCRIRPYSRHSHHSAISRSPHKQISSENVSFKTLGCTPLLTWNSIHHTQPTPATLEKSERKKLQPGPVIS